MRNKLNLKYTRLKHQVSEQTKTDQVLAVFRKFKGKCTNCGKFRHKSSKCRSKKQNSQQEGRNSEGNKLKLPTNKSKIKCFSCSEMGHYCSKCPKNNLKKSTTKQSETVEMVLMAVEGKEWLREDIWITDSAASTHIVIAK